MGYKGLREEGRKEGRGTCGRQADIMKDSQGQIQHFFTKLFLKAGIAASAPFEETLGRIRCCTIQRTMLLSTQKITAMAFVQYVHRASVVWLSAFIPGKVHPSPVIPDVRISILFDGKPEAATAAAAPPPL